MIRAWYVHGDQDHRAAIPSCPSHITKGNSTELLRNFTSFSARLDKQFNVLLRTILGTGGCHDRDLIEKW